MKNYEAPLMTILDDYVEGVYAQGSGWVPPTPPTPPTPAGGEWDIETAFANHNSGSHSELKIRGKHHGTKGGNTLTMNFVVACGACDLSTVKDWGGMVVSNVREDGFTITRNNWFNPTDNFEFNIQITCSRSRERNDGGLAYGYTGQQYESPFVCTSYISC